MYNLLVTVSSPENGYWPSFLDNFSFIAILAGIAVIIVKNPILSLIALIGVYGFISMFLMLTGLTFIGFSYIIVYIGAVSILFIFILMLIDIRTSELQINNWNSIPLASIIVIFLNFALTEGLPVIMTLLNSIKSGILFNLKELISNNQVLSFVDNMNIMYVSSNNWDGNMAETSHISTLGNILYTSYNMWLFITSIILLLAMVGAIVITIKTK